MYQIIGYSDDCVDFGPIWMDSFVAAIKRARMLEDYGDVVFLSSWTPQGLRTIRFWG